ncbi:MAG: 3,4-dehydroadipyl-CoA semialdehyde dehydrogenase [Acidobacteriota bacterium]
MHTVKSYVEGRWHEADSGFRPLVDPSTEEVIAQVSSHGIDFAAVLDHAHTEGCPSLAALTFAERGALLKGMSKVLRNHRDELLALSAQNTGTTTPDGSFDVDGASGTLFYYAGLATSMGDSNVLVEGDGSALARDDAFWSQHALVARRGAAVAINAFNFPIWGWAEKVACAVLAGMPVIIKPATSTALPAARSIERIVEADILPAGVLQMICGGTGDLLDRLGPQDVLAFTGSADTAAKLSDRDNLRQHNTRINIEADSLNAAVLAPDADGRTFDLFVKDVVREMTQKTGQKCTAVRRILVPTALLDRAREALVDRLGAVVPGNPADEATTMGPLANADQLDDTVRGTAELRAQAELVHGSGERVDGVGGDAGKGYFFGPTLLLANDSYDADVIHSREVFAPVATLLPYDGSADHAGALVAKGGGTLVTSTYTDDTDWLRGFLLAGGHSTGRLYVGSQEAKVLGSGVALPQSQHGGPGRAGGGEELGGMVGVKRYMQRVALQAHKGVVDSVLG